MIAVITAMVLMGIAGADSAFSYQSYTDRPGNFIMNDIASVSGFISFAATTLANAGGIYEMTQVNTLPCNMQLGAPEEKSYQKINLNFYKDGTVTDPAVQEIVQSDITVGSTSTAKIPTFGPNGILTPGSGVGEGYDIMQSTVGGIVGTPIQTNGHVTGINGISGSAREVFANIESAQDDYIWAQGADSAGTDSDTLSSWTTAQVGSSTMPEGTPYNQFTWQDTRGYGLVPDQWTIQNIVSFDQILPSDYRSGKYIGIFP